MSADVERTAVGEAEAAAFGGTDCECPRPVEVLTALTADVTGGSWWATAGGPVVTVTAARVSARSSRARSAGSAAPVEVVIADGQCDLATLTHELAHALVGPGRGHDATFRSAYVDLVTLVAGPSAGIVLADAFDAFGLALAVGPWPRPWRGEGDGFRMLAATDVVW